MGTEQKDSISRKKMVLGTALASGALLVGLGACSSQDKIGVLEPTVRPTNTPGDLVIPTISTTITQEPDYLSTISSKDVQLTQVNGMLTQLNSENQTLKAPTPTLSPTETSTLTPSVTETATITPLPDYNNPRLASFNLLKEKDDNKTWKNILNPTFASDPNNDGFTAALNTKPKDFATFGEPNKDPRKNFDMGFTPDSKIFSAVEIMSQSSTLTLGELLSNINANGVMANGVYGDLGPSTAFAALMEWARNPKYSYLRSETIDQIFANTEYVTEIKTIQTQILARALKQFNLPEAKQLDPVFDKLPSVFTISDQFNTCEENFGIPNIDPNNRNDKSKIVPRSVTYKSGIKDTVNTANIQNESYFVAVSSIFDQTGTKLKTADFTATDRTYRFESDAIVPLNEQDLEVAKNILRTCGYSAIVTPVGVLTATPGIIAFTPSPTEILTSTPVSTQESSPTLTATVAPSTTSTEQIPTYTATTMITNTEIPTVEVTPAHPSPTFNPTATPSIENTQTPTKFIAPSPTLENTQPPNTFTPTNVVDTQTPVPTLKKLTLTPAPSNTDIFKSVTPAHPSPTFNSTGTATSGNPNVEINTNIVEPESVPTTNANYSNITPIAGQSY